MPKTVAQKLQQYNISENEASDTLRLKIEERLLSYHQMQSLLKSFHERSPKNQALLHGNERYLRYLLTFVFSRFTVIQNIKHIKN